MFLLNIPIVIEVLKEFLTKMLFHPKYLGDIYASDFVGDGSTYAWWNY